MKDAHIVSERWSVIREDYRKLLQPGEKAEEKDRLEDMCKFLKEVHTDARMVWKQGKEDLRNNREDIQENDRFQTQLYLYISN